ncbi:alpha/beta hydrolase [Hymenobacter nivis]|uniref:Alpha/beta hydrolase n=1 Tax=Hymenobacter nivis TaxID=1850093 RepID=A0A2Z3GJX6_9BACT|nr:hypothetical protein [Hymenobacter nivis]AWM32611.1 hypothetical protein DDQ68_07335 [Hymenobacter nivis]
MLALLLLLLPLARPARADADADLAAKLGFKLLRLTQRGETTSFLVAGTPAQLCQRKPVVVLCQGSEVRPLFAVDDKGPFFIGWPQDLKPYQDRYHFVIINKPGLPLVAPVAALTASMDYMDPVTGHVPLILREHDTPQQYAATAEAVLRYLRRQPWVDPQNTAVVGVSQGYHTAVWLAKIDRHITHAALLSSNPYSRLHQYVSDARAEQYRGTLAPARAQSQIDSLYLEYHALMLGTETAAQPWVGEHWRNWISVTKYAAIDNMLQLRIPLFVGYGTADVGSALNDMLPFEFDRRGKTNLTLHAYPGLDHHFAIPTPDKNGKPSEPEWHDDDVFKDVMAWMEAPVRSAR